MNGFSSTVLLRLMIRRILCYAKIRRACSFKLLRANATAATAGFLIFFTIIWTTGMSDFLFEKNFQHFKWPPYIDVRKKVVNDMLNSSSDGEHVYQEWGQFVPLVRPSCKQNRFTRRKFLLIIVKTAPQRFAHREAIRATYGSVAEQSGFRLRTIFSMGLPPNSLSDAVLEESSMHGDMLIGNFVDSYYNNTYKFLNSLELAQSYCGEGRVVPYLFLVDDDYMVSPRNLVAEARRHAPNERLYMGWRFLSSPFRLTFQKHRVSLEDYPYAAYPPYVTAGAVLLTGQTVREFYLAVKYTKLFVFDDVYAGILAYLLGINAVQNDNFCLTCPTGNTELEEWQNWRVYVAKHGFQPPTIIEKYQKFVEAETPPTI